MGTGRYRIYRDITNGQYRWLMGPESPLSTEEKQILSHVRRGDPIGLLELCKVLACPPSQLLVADLFVRVEA